MSMTSHESETAPLAEGALRKYGVAALKSEVPGIEDELLETVVAYAESRLSKTESKEIRHRLRSDPALREALADLILAARGSDYEKVLQESEAARSTSASLTPGATRTIAASCAASTICHIFRILDGIVPTKNVRVKSEW